MARVIGFIVAMNAESRTPKGQSFRQGIKVHAKRAKLGVLVESADLVTPQGKGTDLPLSLSEEIIAAYSVPGISYSDHEPARIGKASGRLLVTPRH